METSDNNNNRNMFFRVHRLSSDNGVRGAPCRRASVFVASDFVASDFVATDFFASDFVGRVFVASVFLVVLMIQRL